jgi:FtsP/CotA-like multicopper oxidase with cupredoxin domain
MTPVAKSRRNFLAGLGLAAGAVGVTAACIQAPSGPRTGSALPPAQAAHAAPAAPAVAPAAAHGGQMAGMDHTRAAAPPAKAAAPAPAATANPAVSALTKAEEMDKHHEAGIKAFPAKTALHGNQRLPFTLDGDVKVFEVTASRIKWEVEPGKLVDAFAYNGIVPGPEIRVTEGDKVRVVLKNAMDQSTAIHFHGQRTPNAVDGVPFITQPVVKPGQSYTYEFVARPAGSHMYHSHHNAAEQVPGGLLGAFIVDPKDPSKKLAYDVEYLMVLNDGPLGGFTLNGKSFPATQPLTARVGQKVLIRYMNEGSMIHPMHLHGFPQTVVAKDGYPQAPWQCDTLNIAPGDRWDVIVEPDEPGVWAFHCHILPHAESPNGMFGMVTALIVEK